MPCAHNYANGVCSSCAAVCNHSYKDGHCLFCAIDCPHVFIDSISEIEGTWEAIFEAGSSTYPAGTKFTLIIDVADNGAVTVTVKTDDSEWTRLSVQFDDAKIVYKGMRPGKTTQTTLNFVYDKAAGTLTVSTPALSFVKK